MAHAAGIAAAHINFPEDPTDIYTSPFDSLPLCDANGHALRVHEVGGVVQANSAVDHQGNVHTINAATGVVQDATPANVAQPHGFIRTWILNRRNNVLNAVGRAPPVVTFGRTPGQARAAVGHVIDYCTKEGQTIYKQATASLYHDGEDKFDLDSDKLTWFLDKLSYRANEQRWQIVEVTDPVPAGGWGGDPPTRTNILTNYGEVTLACCRIDATAHAGANNLNSQHDEQLFKCLTASLTEPAMATVNQHYDDFFVNDVLSGICLLRIIITEAYADTNSKILLMYSKLTTGMTTIMNEKGGNIKAFNEAITTIKRTLAAQGQNADYNIPQLFQVYQAVEGTDGPFTRYIEHPQESVWGWYTPAHG